MSNKKVGEKQKDWTRKQSCLGCSEPGLPDGIFFKTKIPIWVNFGGPQNDGNCFPYVIVNCNILRLCVIFYGRLVIWW
jgi:hypothetical protein